MSEPTDIPQSELIEEARRTTHAARALARFVLLIVTYQVIVGFVIGLGLVMAFATGEEGPVFAFVVIGGLLSLAGLIHSLSAGYSELAKSERFVEGQALPQEQPEELPEKDERGLYEGTCSCTRWERGVGGAAFVDGIEYCQRCNRVLPK